MWPCNRLSSRLIRNWPFRPNTTHTLMTYTIMLVDDSSICNLIMRKGLSQLPITLDIRDFTEPVLAFSQITAVNPTVIFLDINMPELDGWGFLQQMKDAALTTPVIMMTSSTSALDRSRCAEFSNVLAYHNKPLTKTMLTDLLHLFQTQLSMEV